MAVLVCGLVVACSSAPRPLEVPPTPPSGPMGVGDSLVLDDTIVNVQDSRTVVPIAEATTSTPPVAPGLDAPNRRPSVARTHTIAKGETLMALARSYYGQASAWRTILEANRNQISNPDRIFVGQVLVIPD